MDGSEETGARVRQVARDVLAIPTWRRVCAQVWLHRLALSAIAALAGLLYAWAMGQDTLEYYYAAADRSMSMSWHNFIFGAFDPAGTSTVDKLPGALWIQALSVRAFGLHTWAIILPQVIEGILTVLVLYRAVTRLAGPAAGLIAALVLAVSPATVALDRENISDSLLILLLVLAADAVSGAIAGLAAGDAGQDAGTLGRLILAGFWVGLAFQAKEIEAWMVLPALGLAYLLSGPGPVLRRRPARGRGCGRRAGVGVLDDRRVAGARRGPALCRRQPRQLRLRAGLRL